MNDIEKLLAGRKLIDDCRALKSDIRIKDSVDTGLMQAKFTDAITKRDAQLKRLGFGSADEVFIFNGEMCLKGLKTALEIMTLCDNCKGFEGVPPCTLTRCSKDCYYYTWKGTEADIERHYLWILDIWRHATVYEDGTFTIHDEEHKNAVTVSGSLADNSVNICPAGHGFQYKWNGLPVYDLNWS